MHFDLTSLAPVAIALERIEVEGDLRFSGLDLDSGEEVTVTIEHAGESAAAMAGETRDLKGLVLVLSLGRASEDA